MGNCIPKPEEHHHHHHHYDCHHIEKIVTPKKKPTTISEITPSPSPSPATKPKLLKHESTLCGDPENPATYILRYMLTLKPSLSLSYFPSQMPLSLFTLRLNEADGPFSGDLDSVLRYVNEKLPDDDELLLRRRESGVEEREVIVRRMAELQHKSMMWHLERVVRWGNDLAARGGKANGDPSVGTPKMEVGKFGKSYGKLLEVLLEHAKMEEMLVFPILNKADRGICRCVNEEHGRDLPIMNGIKESIKSIAVLNSGSSTIREALYALSSRLETLQENCKEHFNEEEKNLFPLLEAADLTREQQRKVVEQSTDVMQGTHSHLFRFFIEGLLPHEALEYLELLMNCLDRQKATSLIRTLVD